MRKTIVFAAASVVAIIATAEVVYTYENDSKTYVATCRVDFKSGIFVESKSGMGFVRSALDFTLFELSDCC
jgi:hypothetical protein